MADTGIRTSDDFAEGVGADGDADAQLPQPPQAPGAWSAEAASRSAVPCNPTRAGKRANIAAIPLAKRRRRARGPNA
jgi:hypothetical protein